MENYDDLIKAYETQSVFEEAEEEKEGFEFVPVETALALTDGCEDDFEAYDTEGEEKKRRILPVAIILTVALFTATVCWMILFQVDRGTQMTGVLPTDTDVPGEPAATESDWRGAFDSKDVYERCFSGSVAVRASNGEVWSGFVFDVDGWIATSLDNGDLFENGKLTVMLNNGSEYEVEGICRDRDSGLALLKISASGLAPLTFADSEVHGGERIISFGACDDGICRIFSGEVSGIGKSGELACITDGKRYESTLVRINISGGAEVRGAPIFDENGVLLGIASSDGAVKNGKVCQAISAKDCQSILSQIKH